jgi:hypothetical protein
MNRNFAHRFTTAVAGPIVAAGIFAGTMVVAGTAEASTQTMPGNTQCSSMAMPNDEANANSLNPLTRAAQVAAVNPTPQAPISNMSC